MSRFSDYLQKTFDLSSSEVEGIIEAMKQPLGKSIRINTRKISLEKFVLHAKEQGWSLTETDIPEVFLIDREDTSVALWNTLEHRAGWFYIQEVAAAHPPALLRKAILWWYDNTIQERESQSDYPIIGLSNYPSCILDMCAAPGGKTTQLADYFPESLVIANEVNRTRTPQLFENLDRMGYDNVAAISCDGRFFQNFPDFFDAVLLDAPCSGEGTAFRDSSVLDHWHEKNIHRIAKLQKQLFETAQNITKSEGFLSYSTCTLNKEENEAVIESLDEEWEQREKIKEKRGGIIYKNPQLLTLNSKLLTSKSWKSVLKKLFEKRYWPHIEHTGGFFASIFQKNSSQNSLHSYPILAAEGQKHLIVKPATKGEYEIVERFISKHLKTSLKNGFLYLTKDGVYFNQKNLGPLAEYFYFVHGGMRIGTIRGTAFTPTHHLYWCLEEVDQIPSIEMSLTSENFEDDPKSDGYYVVRYGQWILGIACIKNGCIIKGFL